MKTKSRTKVIITDKILPWYGEEYYILWESKSFLHLGKDPNSSIADRYCGRGQCDIIKSKRYKVVETGHLGDQGTVIDGFNLSKGDATKLMNKCNKKSRDSWTWYEIREHK